MGSKPVLEALLDTVMNIAVKGPPDVVLDVITAMVCAPVTGERFSLRQALHSAYSDAYVLSKRNAARAEMLVRLYRRVEAQAPIGGGSGTDGGMGGAIEGGVGVGVGADAGDMLLDMGVAAGGGEAGHEGMEGMMDVGLDLQMGDMMGAGAEGDDFLGL